MDFYHNKLLVVAFRAQPLTFNPLHTNAGLQFGLNKTFSLGQFGECDTALCREQNIAIFTAVGRLEEEFGMLDSRFTHGFNCLSAQGILEILLSLIGVLSISVVIQWFEPPRSTITNWEGKGTETKGVAAMSQIDPSTGKIKLTSAEMYHTLIRMVAYSILVLIKQAKEENIKQAKEEDNSSFEHGSNPVPSCLPYTTHNFQRAIAIKMPVVLPWFSCPSKLKPTTTHLEDKVEI